MPKEELSTLIGRDVMLTAVDTGEYHVFGIDAATPTITVLHPTTSEARAFAAKLPDDAPLRLSVAVTEGLLVTNVVVERWSPVGRVLSVRVASSTGLVQRRATFRVPVALPVQITYERERDVVVAEGQTLDVSERGLAVVAKGVPLETGDLTAISLQLRSGPLLVVARVVVPGDGVKLPVRLSISQIMPTDTTRFASDLRQAELNIVRTVVGRRGA